MYQQNTAHKMLMIYCQYCSLDVHSFADMKGEAGKSTPKVYNTEAFEDDTVDEFEEKTRF